MSSLAVLGTNVFAGTNAGVYLTTNNGESWNPVNSGLTSTNITSLAVSDSNLFAGTGGGVFLSTNNGTSWTAANSGLADPLINSLVTDGTNLFAGTWSGVYFSTNNGTSWNQSHSGLTYNGILSLVINDTNLFAGTNESGVWRESLWQMIPPSVPTLVSPGDSTTNQPAKVTLEVNTAAGANSYSWQVSLNPTFSSTVVNDLTSGASDTAHAVTLTAGTKYYWRVQASDAGGTSAFSVSDSFTVMAVPAIPVLASPANSAQNERVDTLVLEWYSVSEDTGYVCQLSTNPTFSSLVVSSDSTRDTTFKVTSLKNLQKYYWRVGSYNAGGTSAFATKDSFTTIIAIPTVPALVSPRQNAANQPANLTLKVDSVAGASGYHWQVSVNSAFLSTVVNDSTGGTGDTAQTVVLTAGTKYYWEVQAFNIGGSSAFSGPDSFTVMAVPTVPMLASPVGTTGEPRRTTFKWESSINATMYRLQVATDSTIDSVGEFINADVVFDTTLTDTTKKLSSPLSANKKYYWHVSATDTAGTSNYSSIGAYLTGVGIDAIDELPGIPKEFALSQNYPNPFNPTTVINYQLPVNSFVTLKIYDILGREVMTLVNGRQSAGYYNATFKAMNLPSGIYFYRHQAGTYSNTRKLLLLK